MKAETILTTMIGKFRTNYDASMGRGKEAQAIMELEHPISQWQTPCAQRSARI
jgi:hypothetical protein